MKLDLPPLCVQETLQSDSSSSPATKPDASFRSYFPSLPILYELETPWSQSTLTQPSSPTLLTI